MPRRSRSCALEDLLETVARLPWWAGVILAIVSWAFLHHAAGQPLSVGTPTGPHASLILAVAWRALANVLQFVVPVTCLVGAGLSVWQRSHRDRLVAGVAEGTATEVLHDMTWQEFEVLVAEAFRLQGWRVAETGSGGPDGGVDLVLTRGRETFLVQCKQWRALKVGVEVVRELYGVIAARGATGGFVVTAGRFTDDATAFAQGRNLRLVDGPQLQRMIRQARDSVGRARPATTASPPARAQPAAPAGANAPTRPLTPEPPACPACGRAMVQRTARRGPSAGAPFWGCTGYPTCRGTRPGT